MDPTARIAAWGGLITAVNSVIPYIPRFEMQNDPPLYSLSLSLPVCALLASDFTSDEIWPRFLKSACRTIGVINPSSIETAMEISTVSY